MQAIKLSIIIAISYLATGCASFSDMKNLQSQINLLTPQVSEVIAFAATSKKISNESLIKATNAEATANRAAQKIREVSGRLDASIPHHCLFGP